MKFFAMFIILASVGSAYASPCQKVDLSGAWADDHGGQFRIVQNGCQTARLTDLKTKTVWGFDLTGKTAVSVPRKFLSETVGTKGEQVIESSGISSLIDASSQNNAPVIKLKLQGIINIPGLTPGSKHRITVESTADGFLDGANFDSNGFTGVFNKVWIRFTSMRVVSIDDSSIPANEQGPFLRGANTILNLIKDAFDLSIHRK